LVFHPIYSQLDLPVRHRFPIEKYQGIKDALLKKGVPENQFTRPSPLDLAALSNVYDPSYVRELCAGSLDPKAMRRIGFPWSEQLIQRTLTAAGGTVLTAELALDSGKALNLTGGYHHAFANFGSGFCMINDLYLAALNMLQSPKIDKVLIFDCDVHQGDGTAKLAENNDAVYTVSIHGEKNFPYRKQRSNLDFGLSKGTEDDEFLVTVEQAWHMAIAYFQPDAVIYDAGVDVHINDDLGHLNITTEGVFARDKFVFEQCKVLGLPVAAVIGGGYQRDIDALVDVHLQLFKAAGVYN
jgi:acetoin utilization deacetylase AcuC-like enzyme